MSFADLQSIRKSKESKSFVNPNNVGVHDKADKAKSNYGDGTEGENGKTNPTVVYDRPVGLPATVEVRASAVDGRGVYASIPFYPGDVISSLRPRVAVLSTAFLDSFCSHCCRPAPAEGLKRCVRCRTLWYCDPSCQAKDWSHHKRECEALQLWGSTAPSAEFLVPSDAIRCLGRILWTRQRKGPDSEFAKEWSNLQSHRTSLPPAAFESHTHLAHSVVRYLGVTSPADLAPYGLSSAGELVDLISRFTTNAFTLTSFSLDPIGVCVSPAYAFINHSCEPNTALVFPHLSSNALQEPQMQLISLRPVVVDEEILISYVDTTSPLEHRHKALKDTYNFVCNCTLCRRVVRLDPRQSLCCPKSCGGICPVPVEESDIVLCNKCEAALAKPEAVLDALRIGQEALDKAISIRIKEPTKSLQLTTNMIPILTSAGLTPSCHPLLALSRLHQELLIDTFTPQLSQDLLDEAIQASARFCTGLSNILDFGHPVRAVALAELGKLLAVDEKTASEPSSVGRYPPSGPPRLRLAYETLVKAREEALVGFGKSNEGGRMGKDIREVLIRLEKELGVWTEGIRNAIKDQQVRPIRK